MTEYQPYVVKAGDYLAKIAHEHGFAIFDVWNHPLNAELKQKRGSPDILYPGDVLYIPVEVAEALLPMALQAVNQYTATVPGVTVNLRFVFGAYGDAPLADEKCEIRGLPGDGPATYTTDGDGKLSVVVPPTVRAFEVRFVEKGIAYPIRIGEMDPIDEPLGVTKRLANLGFLSSELGYSSGCPEDARVRAIKAFQCQQKIPSTGVADEETRAALVRAHGT